MERALPAVIVVALTLAVAADAWLLGAAYWLGMMSHPIQGWMVNALAHRFGYRNYELSDNSRNNTFVALCAMGEGYQNNHHHDPRAAKFSVKRSEIDLGYALCFVAQWLGLVTMTKALAERPAGSEGQA